MSGFWDRFKEAQSHQYQQIGYSRPAPEQGAPDAASPPAISPAQGRGSAPAMNAGVFTPLVILLGIMWAAYAVSFVLPGSLNWLGIRSWSLPGLGGIFTAPFIHSGLRHLVGNTLSLVVLGALVSLEGARRFLVVSLLVALVAGLGAWAVNAPGTVTLGASGLVFGYFGYLVAGAFFTGWGRGKLLRIVLAVLVVAVYGASIFFGLVGVRAGISWQAHLFGLLGGVLAAWALRSRARE